MEIIDKNGKLYHTRVGENDIGKYVFLIDDPFKSDAIAQYLDNPKLIAHNREHRTWTGFLAGEKVSVVSTGTGSPSAAIALEELIKCGAHTFIKIGSEHREFEKAKSLGVAGIICTGAVRDEGTTIHYAPIDYPAFADRIIIEALSKSAKNNNSNFIEGIIRTVDNRTSEANPLFEHFKARVAVLEKANILCTDMESSALFVIGSIRKVRVGTIINLSNIEETVKIARDALKSLIIVDKTKEQTEEFAKYNREK